MKKWITIAFLSVFGWQVVKATSNNTNSPSIPTEPEEPNSFNINEQFKKAIIKSFGSLSTTQISAIDSIVAAFNLYGDNDYNKLVYIFATSYHESKIKPIRERRAKVGTALYELQNRYWLTGYYGRGFVQLTWERNYKKMSDFLGVDLVGNPDLALDPYFAAQILVFGMLNGSFTRKSLRDYINPYSQDFFNARKTVNGTDKASLIEGYAYRIIENLDFNLTI